MIESIAKVFIPTALAFFIGVAITPFISNFLYQKKLWKRVARKESDQTMSQVFHKINNAEEELKTPRIGGVIIWISVLLTAFLIWLLSLLFPSDSTLKLNFISRNQTFIPLFALFIASMVGLIDDLLGIFKQAGKFINGFPREYILTIVTAFGLIGGWWFFSKLGISSIHVPFYGDLDLGLSFVFLFMLVTLTTFSSGVIDGIDGLASGVMAIIFSAFTVVAYFQDQIDV